MHLIRKPATINNPQQHRSSVVRNTIPRCIFSGILGEGWPLGDGAAHVGAVRPGALCTPGPDHRAAAAAPAAAGQLLLLPLRRAEREPPAVRTLRRKMRAPACVVAEAEDGPAATSRMEPRVD